MRPVATIDVPGIGKLDRRWIYGGAAVAGLIVAVAWWRARNANTTIEDPAGAFTGAELPPDASTTPGISFTPPEPPDPDTLPPTTNAQWVQRSVDYLQNIGYDPQLVAAVLGKYLARVPVTSAEADIIRTAEGAIGKPPVGEHRIILVGSPPAPPQTPPPASPVIPPGYWYTIPRGFVPAHQNGTSAVFKKMMVVTGWGAFTEAKKNKIWYHPNNKQVREKHSQNWTLMKMTESLFVPHPY